MTKWVEDKDVVFTCQQDIFAHLAKCGVVRHINAIGENGIAFFENGKLNNDWNFYDFKEWVPVKKSEWYEDIPEQGVIGKAWDGDEMDALMTVCINYRIGFDYKFLTPTGKFFKNFRPFTKEEVMQYILEP